MLALVFLLGINGMASAITARFCQQPDWTPHERNRKIAKIHRWLGVATLIMAGITICGGF